MEKKRVMIFIDGSNFYHGLKNVVGKVNINFQKLAEKLCGERELIRIYYYNAPVKREEDEEKYRSQQKFFSALDDVPYLTIKLGRLEKRGDIWVEKGVDVHLAVDMLSMAVKNLYDVAILISGDGDFASAIDAVKDLGKHVEVAYVSQTYQLKTSWDKFIPLTSEYLNDCFLATSQI
jgi:uncharacterized LabA/DUF88 family protein